MRLPLPDVIIPATVLGLPDHGGYSGRKPGLHRPASYFPMQQQQASSPSADQVATQGRVLWGFQPSVSGSLIERSSAPSTPCTASPGRHRTRTLCWRLNTDFRKNLMSNRSLEFTRLYGQRMEDLTAACAVQVDTVTACNNKVIRWSVSNLLDGIDYSNATSMAILSFFATCPQPWPQEPVKWFSTMPNTDFKSMSRFKCSWAYGGFFLFPYMRVMDIVETLVKNYVTIPAVDSQGFPNNCVAIESMWGKPNDLLQKIPVTGSDHDAEALPRRVLEYFSLVQAHIFAHDPHSIIVNPMKEGISLEAGKTYHIFVNMVSIYASILSVYVSIA
ncbi:hypothetical protein CEXT_149391 [Caerostris extrusa]|uniref:Uncharacterized protein n=1 Tax=Caerostris extrusa TaxID=172846 RepID=A0AAV4NJY7_CAEEX|nr:hypothetical protein CEXT_149391 [Caerostris extrusa]